MASSSIVHFVRMAHVVNPQYPGLSRHTNIRFLCCVFGMDVLADLIEQPARLQRWLFLRRRRLTEFAVSVLTVHISTADIIWRDIKGLRVRCLFSYLARCETSLNIRSLQQVMAEI